MRPLSNMLAQLEYDMGIVCQSSRCTRQASHVVIVHTIDRCDKGTCNAVFIKCQQCADHLVGRIAEMVQKMREAVAQRDAELECTSCGKRIKNLTDMCRSQRLVYQVDA
jgi:hypothetical protein